MSNHDYDIREPDHDALATARAEEWRAGYAAGLEAAAREANSTPIPEAYWAAPAQGHAWMAGTSEAAARIRSLAIPEAPNG